MSAFLRQTGSGCRARFMTKKACVQSPADIAGVRARSPNLPMYIKSWELMGTVPVTTPYGEAYLAISQGLVDMTESAGEQVYSSKFFELLPYVTEAQIMYPQNSVYIAESSWAQLDKTDQEIMRQAAFDAGKYFQEIVAERVAPDRAAMEKAGVTFCTISDEARAEFSRLAAAKVPELEAAGLLPEGWWDQIQAMK